MIDSKYYCPNMTSAVDKEQLKGLYEEEQIGIMRMWFYSNYEDPVEHCPYESREGGYQFIWGGPYNARDELESEFSELVSEEAINKLVEELDFHCFDWSGQISSDCYDEYFYSVIYDNYEFTETLKDNLNNIKRLLSIELNGELQQNMYKMLFVNVITALETFLSDAFIGTVLKDKELLRKLVSSNPDFAERKFTLNQIFDRYETIEKEVKTYLVDLIWHNLAKVRQMFKSTLCIDFPKDMSAIFQGIIKRHDIVHRNGRTKSGDIVTVSRDELIKLMNDVNKFAEGVDGYFNV